MHGLNTIVRLNQVEQDFVDHILTKPRPPEQNLLDVWREFKKEQTKDKADEQLSLRAYR
tara:strand:- start:56 stop:232 length:177 start_codon:yes stop_codon:yes gene_type:complete